nr:hypothetical protein [Leptospira weilii]
MRPRNDSSVHYQNSFQYGNGNLQAESPHGEVKNLYGLNAGIVNAVKNRIIGAQVGILNFARNLIGIQIGAVNLTHRKHAGLKIGLFNFGVPLHALAPDSVDIPTTRIGVSIGIANFETQNGNISIGIYNYEAGINIGIINISDPHHKQIQIEIINYCPNNTIPIMIVANYCSNSSIQPKSQETIDTTVEPAK